MSDLLARAVESIEFASPEYLLALPIAAALLVLGLIVHLLKLRGRPARTHGSSYPLVGRIKLWYVSVLVLAVASIAAARPFFAYGGSSFKRGDVDVAIAIDVSASMWVKDLGPSRLEVAIRDALALQSQDILRGGDRAAVFVFGGTAMRKVHLSTNVERLMDVVGKLRPPETLTGDAFPWDSDIASALEHIYQSLDNQDRFQAGEDEDEWEPVKRTDRVVLLFSDGDFAADAEQMKRLDVALIEIQRRGLAIYPIGIGTRGGVELLEILRDYEPGRDFDDTLPADLADQRTRLNMEGLSLLAQRTGGKTFMIDSVGMNASAFMRDAVDSHRAVSFQLIPEEERQEVWQYVVLTSIVLFVLAVLFY